MTLRVSIPSLDVFRRALDRMVEDGRRHAASLLPQTATAGDLDAATDETPKRETYAERVAAIAVARGYPAAQPMTPEGAAMLRRIGGQGARILPPELYPPEEREEMDPVDVRSIFPEFPVDAPMPGGIRLPPVDVDAHEFGVRGQIPARPILPEARKAADYTVELTGPEWRRLTVDFAESPSDAEISIRPPPGSRFPCDYVVHGCADGVDGLYRVTEVDRFCNPTAMERIGDAFAPEPPAPPAPPPFDPVRAWAEVGMAWMRCAYVTAEVPWQLALYQRVAVGL